ncbi:NAD(P)/FAD-dependent oxidoreductase [Xanthobacter aminoxidans]|uniref:NAD(P)/FAD-dependent oxidoreductase n=1 Tax=Xanthobacter aminoxidans TaxID=186280 RepID=UPI00372CFFA6
MQMPPAPGTDPKSHGLWAMTAPPPPETTPLAGDARADARVDVAVVGAGYTGLAAALRLAGAGARVTVLEAAGIGSGGAGRNVGLVNAGLWVMPDDIVATLGAEKGEGLLSLLGGAPAEVFALVARHAIPCEATPNGTLHCAVGRAGRAEIEARAAQWQARGAPVHLLDADAARAMIGGGTYRGALLDDRAGTIQPLAYARGLARAAMGAGAVIHTASPVRAAEEGAGGWVLRTDGGRLAADWIIVATDAYSFGPWERLAREQVPLPYFNFATPPVPDALRQRILPGRQGIWDTQQVLTSLRYDAAGRLVFGSIGALGGLAGVHEAYARRALARLFPELPPAPFEAGWFGTIGMTDDALPRLRRLARNVVSISGYNGRGIGPGTVFGRLLADLVLGRIRPEEVPLPERDVTVPRWRAAQAAFYAAGSAAAHLVGERRPG